MDLKGREKTLKHSASCLKKGRGWRHFFYHRQWQKRNECNILHKVHWGRSPVLLWIHSSASGQPSYTVHYCVRLKEEEKKEEGAVEGKKTCLCAGNGKESLCLSVFARESKNFFPPTLTPGSIFSCSTRPKLHMSELVGPANSDTPASPDDESWRQTGFHEYWCGG